MSVSEVDGAPALLSIGAGAEGRAWARWTARTARGLRIPVGAMISHAS